MNYPNDYDYTRVTEFKHLTGQRHPMTTIVYEYPRAEGDPYYPIPRPDNAERYKAYEAPRGTDTQCPLRWTAGHVPLLHGSGGGPGTHGLAAHSLRTNPDPRVERIYAGAVGRNRVHGQPHR